MVACHTPETASNTQKQQTLQEHPLLESCERGSQEQSINETEPCSPDEVARGLQTPPSQLAQCLGNDTVEQTGVEVGDCATESHEGASASNDVSTARTMVGLGD